MLIGESNTAVPAFAVSFRGNAGPAGRAPARTQKLALQGRVDVGQRLLQESFGELLDGLVAADVFAQRLGSGLDQALWIAPD